MTFKEALKRALATLIQSTAATLVVLLTAFLAGAATTAFVTGTVITGVAIPTATAIQRLAQAYNDSRSK